MSLPDFLILFTRESLDLAMLVFLWLVQIIIYPSFKKISREYILSWHKSYQTKVCLIMGPIMLLQIYGITIDLINSISPITVIRFILLTISWLLTIMISVPLHKKIESNNDLERSIDKLIKTNVTRTFTWTSIYLTHFL